MGVCELDGFGEEGVGEGEEGEGGGVVRGGVGLGGDGWGEGGVGGRVERVWGVRRRRGDIFGWMEAWWMWLLEVEVEMEVDGKRLRIGKGELG